MSHYSKKRLMVRIATFPVLLGIVFLGTLFSQSLGDLAKQQRARVSRDGGTGKVFTNDDIDARRSGHGETAAVESSDTVKGAEAKEGESAAGEGKDKADSKTAKGEKDSKSPEASKTDAKQASADRDAALEKQYRDRFAKLRDAEALAKDKLDVMQRELNLMQTQYYSDPDEALREQTFRTQINDRTEAIKQQQETVEKATQAIADFQEELRKAGLPPGWAR